jgi:hypothetical protein
VGSNNQGSAGDPVTADEPIDFTSLRQRADAVAARASSDFKLYEVEVSLASATLRIDEVYSLRAHGLCGPLG